MSGYFRSGLRGPFFTQFLPLIPQHQTWQASPENVAVDPKPSLHLKAETFQGIGDNALLAVIPLGR